MNRQFCEGPERLDDGELDGVRVGTIVGPAGVGGLLGEVVGGLLGEVVGASVRQILSVNALRRFNERLDPAIAGTW